MLVKGVTPPGAPYDVKIPTEHRAAVMTALAPDRDDDDRASARVARRAPPATSHVHVVRPRETLTSIAKRYGVSTGDVMRMNSLDKHDAIRPGDRLRITEAASAPRADSSRRREPSRL